jgi:ABC-type transport system involved in cytochrome c biogenesis permease subunit
MILYLHIASVLVLAFISFEKLSLKTRKITAPFLIAIIAAWWKITGFPPFVNGSGSTIFFGTLICIRSFFNLPDSISKALRKAALIIAIAGLFIPFGTEKVQAILSSIWLGIHVPLYFLGYLSLTVSFISSFFKNGAGIERKEAAFSMFFLFAGFLTGAFWAEIAWGRFFGFDSKEVWALATWVLNCCYFLTDKRIEQKFFIRTAFLFMSLTYFVVSFLIPGLHNYG